LSFQVFRIFGKGFVEKSEAALQKDFNDSDWEDICLPHDWSVELGFSRENTAPSTGFLPGGVGWYRKVC